MQPRIRNIRNRRKRVKAFRGICLLDYVPDGYFADAENLTSRGYPMVNTRRGRGVISDCASLSAMYDHGGMVWVSGTKLYYGSDYVGEVQAGEKKFASLGANVVIYPDKLILNTDALSLESIENAVSVTGAAVSACNADGTDAQETTFAKIAAAGIGAGFLEGDGVEIKGLSASGLDGSYILQTVSEDFIVVVAAVSQSVSEEGEISVTRSAPDFDFLCASGNRVWGLSCKDREVRACRLGDAKNWNVFQGISTDSYAASVPSPGEFTGCAAFHGSVVFFKENEIIKLFGTRPSNFELVSSRMPGVERGCGASVAFTDSILYYKGLSGIYAYDGAQPVLISSMLGDTKYSSARAGAINGRYYVSMYDERKGEYALFAYDSHQSAWHRESGGEIRFFAAVGNEMYMASSDGRVFTVHGSGLWYDPAKIVSSRTSVSEKLLPWRAETGLLSLSLPDRQYVTRVHLSFSMEEYGAADVYVRYSPEEEYAHQASLSGPKRNALIPIRICASRASAMQLKIEGKGEFSLGEMIFTYETGGE